MSNENSGRSSESTFIAFARSTGIFFVGSFMSKAITLLLIPLYTNTLPAADYGYYDLSITYVTLLTSFLYCDIWSSVMRMMRDDLEGEAPWRVVASGWAIFTVSSVLYVSIAFIASLFTDIPCLALIILYGLTTNVQSMFSCIARGYGSNIDFAISGVLCTLVNVGLNLLLILVARWGYESLYISYATGFVVQCVYLFVRMKMWEHLQRPSREQIAELFVYSAPLGINSVAYWLLSSLSRVVVASVLSLSANGVFAIGSKFGSTIALATTCFTLAWQDIAFTSEVRNASFYANAVEQYTGFLIACTSLLLPLVSLSFPVLVGTDYAEAYSVVPSFLWIAVVSAVSTFVGNIFYVIKDTRTIGISMVISCLLNIILIYPMTVNYGTLGANLSVLIAFIVNIVLRALILGRKIGFSLNLRSLLPQSCLLVIASFAYYNSHFVLNLLVLAMCLFGILFIYKDKMWLLASNLGKRLMKR